jgi:hypothetical protein
MTSRDLYGSIDAFSKYPTSNNSTGHSDQGDGDFSKAGIFEIILDVFEKEKQAALSAPQDAEKPKII